ncbi:MAG: serine hydrolase domain-containing protein [Henriciella sp.]
MTEIPISGYTSPGFEPVRAAFESNFSKAEELGAAFYAECNGVVLVDLIGGWTDRSRQQPWTGNTLAPVYSTTKGIAALVLASVISKLPNGYETPVSELWPAFAAHGKEHVSIAELASHQAGLPGFPEPIDPELWLAPDQCADALASLAPLWPPGTAHGYHPQSWGYLIGKLVKIIDGRSLGTVLREDFTAIADIDFHIGTAASEHARISDIMRPRQLADLGEINEPTRVAFLTKWAASNRNADTWRTIEIPSANGHGHAKSTARLYSLFANQGRLDDRQIITPEAYDGLIKRRTIGPDLVLPYETDFAAGIMRNNLGFFGPNPETFGHAGWGGSMALADPDERISAAYVMNRQSNKLIGDPRSKRLIDALYKCY